MKIPYCIWKNFWVYKILQISEQDNWKFSWVIKFNLFHVIVSTSGDVCLMLWIWFCSTGISWIPIDLDSSNRQRTPVQTWNAQSAQFICCGCDKGPHGHWPFTEEVLGDILAVFAKWLNHLHYNWSLMVQQRSCTGRARSTVHIDI